MGTTAMGLRVFYSYDKNRYCKDAPNIAIAMPYSLALI